MPIVHSFHTKTEMHDQYSQCILFGDLHEYTFVI